MPRDERSWVIGKQLLRSATSIGANVWEADEALSDAEFAHKISIARKEAAETRYWIELGRRCGLIESDAASSLAAEAKELAAILSTIVRKSQEYIQAQKRVRG